MTTKSDVMLERLDLILAQLEALGITPPPTVDARLDAFGNPSLVAAGELIESAWGNAVVGRVVRAYPTKADLDAVTGPTGSLGVVTGTGMLYRRMAGGWSHMLPIAGAVAGPGGNMPAGTDYMSLPIAADPGPRIIEFVYNGYVTSQVSQGLDIVATLGGTAVSSYRHPGNGASAQVNFARNFIAINAGATATFTIRNTIGVATLVADPFLHNLSYKITPVGP